MSVVSDAAFFDAVLDDPDVVGPRLLFADWLDQTGGPRGPPRRAPVAPDRPPPDDPRRPELAARERDLLGRHRDDWLGPWRPLPNLCTVRGGFLVVRCGASELATINLDEPPRLPVRLFLSASGGLPGEGRLRRLAELGWLAGFDLPRTPAGPLELRRLC